MKIIAVEEGIELHYYPLWVEDPAADFLEAERLSFSPEVVTMFQKASVLKRQTVDYGLTYSYNPTAKASIEWEPLAVRYRQRLERQFKIDFPQCACNEYANRLAYIGPHHDKSTSVNGVRQEPLVIASISLGAMRRMVLIPPGVNLKHMQPTVNWLSKRPGAVVIELEPGSLIVFTNAFNRRWTHSIPKDLKQLVTGKRISLTYRHF